MSVEWGAVCRPKQGQSVSGDTYVVQEFGDQQMLVAVIDGLGGGTEAARASTAAADVLRANPHDPLKELIQQSHRALHQTRGAVVGLLQLSLASNEARFVGVGNIGVYVYSTRSIKPISKNGILGYRLPTLLELHYTYNSGDTFVLYSDGISARFSTENQMMSARAPQVLADDILIQYGKQSDDATVVVVRATT